MSKSMLDKIKNPDVPGFEKVLPLPPPPPPPTISVNTSEPVPNTSNNVTYQNIISRSYFVPLNQANQPWWVPTEADNSEIYNQWYESAYKAALQAAQEKDVTGKPKVKYLKKKSEVVDPKADAEKVANAQKELSALMKPLKCDLCNAIMNSTLQAKLHYQGKPHQKKVSMFLNQSAKIPKFEDGSVSSTTNSDWNLYCDLCKIWFTSQTDASQHYAGKKHQKVAFGISKAKIQKKSQSQTLIPIDTTGRFGIGVAFQSEIQTPTALLNSETPSIIPPVPQYSSMPVPYPTPLQCDLCGVSANRQDQLDTHLKGVKHLKMLKHHGIVVPNPLEIKSPELGKIDYSIHRTPSGQYYCAPCNLSLNSEITFAQHMESKKHKNQINPKQQAPQSPPTKKSKKK